MTTQPEPTTPDLVALLTQQARVANALSTVTSLQSAARIVQALSLDETVKVGLLVYIYDDMGHFAGIRRIHGDEATAQDETITNLALSRVGEMLRAMVAGVGTVTVADVADLKPADAIIRNWLKAMDAASCVGLPVRLEDKSIGALVVANSTAGFMPDASVLAVYQSVASQIATVARLHLLADEVEGARQENHTLSTVRGVHTQASRELLAARDGRDVLRILKAHLARDARQVALYHLDWDIRTGGLNAFTLAYLIMQNGEMRQPDTEMLTILTAQQRDAFLQDWANLTTEVDFVEEIAVEMASRPALKFDHERGINSVINIPIYDDETLVSLISIAYETPRVYPEALRRVYDALRDQISVVMQNRRLLRTTEESLRETRALYDVNRELTSAHTSLDVLRVLKIYIASDDAVISLREFEWGDNPDMPLSWKLTALIDEQGEQTPDASLLEYVKPEDFAAFRADWAQQGQSVDFVEDIERAMQERPVLRYYAAQGVKSSVVIPVYNDGRLSQQIRISYRTPRTFAPNLRRLYGAVRDQMTIILQNRRLLRLTEDTLRETQTIYAANRDLLMVNTPSEVLEGLYNRIAQNADLIYMTRIGWDEDEMSIISARVTDTVSAEGIQHTVQELIDGVTPSEARWLQTRWQGLPNTVEFVSNVPPLLDERPDLRYASAMGARSLALMPVFRRDRLLHQIGIVYREPRHFSEQDERLFAAVSDQINVIMQNQRLLQNSQRQTTQLQTIADFGQATQTLLELDILLRIALDSTLEMLEATYAGIYTSEPGNAGLRIRARSDDGTRSYPDAESADSRIIDRRTTAMQAWHTGRTIFSNNLRRRDDMYHTVYPEIAAVIAVPVFERGEVFGVVEVAARHRDTYTNSDVAALQQLAGQMSAAVENIAAYRRSQRSAESKSRVNEISSKLQQQMDIDRILSVTANELGRALGAKRARIRFGTRDDFANGGNGGGHDPADRE